MSRFINARSVFAATEDTPTTNDNVKEGLENIAKMVPAEILSFFIGVGAILQSQLPAKGAPQNPQIHLYENIYWAMFAIGLVLCPCYFAMIRDESVSASVLRFQQVGSVFAFTIWTYGSGTVFAFHDAVSQSQLFNPVIAGILVLLFTLLTFFWRPSE